MHLPARTTDPVTSHQAAKHIVSTGKAKAQQERAADAVRQHPGRTSLELAQDTGLDRYMLARRLPECARDGLVRRGQARECSISRRQAQTWYIPEGRR